MRWVRVASVVLGVVLGMAAFSLFARSSYVVGPARVTASASLWPSGETRIELPPFGSVQAHTHAAPLLVTLRLDDVDIERLKRLAEQGVPSQRELLRLRTLLVAGAQQAAARGLAAGVLIAAFVAWALSRAGRYAAIAAMIAALLLGGVMGWTVVGFDEDAFREPQFQGTLAFAPGLIQIVERRARDVRRLEQEIGGIARDLANYYARPQSFASGGDLPRTFRVLHETDIHLDPVGFSLSRELARAYNVALVIDTGDVNNLGTFPEGVAAVNGLETIKPLIYVGGNHDSPEIMAALRKRKGVTVLDETSATVSGLKVYGVGDPVGRGLVPDATPDPLVADRIAQQAAGKLKASLKSGETTPNIVAVHQPVMATPFLGIVPVILDGHTHSALLSKRSGTWVVNSGTTGGVSFRGLTSDPHIPHTASILYYTLDLPRRLIAIDTVQVFGKVTQTSLQRTVVDASLLASASIEPTNAAPATGATPPPRR